MTQIDTVLNQAVESGDIPGVVAMAANESGLVYQGAAGKRGDATAPSMTSDTVFRIASMTKAVASVASMQLVEQGKLSLDEPLGAKIPQLANRQVFDGFDPNGSPKLRSATLPVTPKQLLTHTSGYCYEFWNPDFGKFIKQASIPSFNDGGDGFLDWPLVFDPGERWEYGISTDWVGRIVERLSGQNLADYCREHIFQPLGMTDSGFVLTPHQQARVVNVCQRQDDSSLKQVEFELPLDERFFSGGAGMYSTGSDYMAFLQMLLNAGTYNGAQVL
jgi:CubicO group peptidase (beta-lactamase class C family)